VVYYKMFSTVQETVRCDFLGVAGSLLRTQLAERYEKPVAVCDDAGRCEIRGVRLGQPRHRSERNLRVGLGELLLPLDHGSGE
jgi:hypothetical protein